MKKLKHILSVMLIVLMTLTMTMPAFAAANSQGTLTVRVNEGNTLQGQTIKVYKLFDLTVKDSHYAYTVNGDYKAKLAAVLGKEGTASSEDLYNEILKLRGASIQKFAYNFAEAALKNSLKETASSGKINEKLEEYTFNNLDFGYYLIYQTGTEKLQPSLISVDKATGTAVELKGATPGIEKTANKDTVGIGEVITYTIAGEIPDTTGYDEYTYKLHDTLTSGLDFVKDDQGTPQADNSYKVSVKIEGGAAETQTATLSGDGNRTMLLDLSQWVRSKQAQKGKAFTVTYYAKVNENAVVKTNNKAELEYGNDDKNTTLTTPSVVKTPTYPLQIHKSEQGKNDSYLAGAVFRIYKTEEDAKQEKNPIAVTGGNGSYTVEKDGAEYDMTSVGAQLSDNSGMNLRLNGLAAGVYWLVETNAPDGYNKITSPIKITIAKSSTDEITDWTVSKGDGAANGKQIIVIENSTGILLPDTGGMGTIIFTVVGAALVVLVAASFIVSRRRRQS